MSPYLTQAEAAELLRISPKNLHRKKVLGIFVEGRHYFKKRGLRPLWDRAALVAWLEGKDDEGLPEKIWCSPARRSA